MFFNLSVVLAMYYKIGSKFDPGLVVVLRKAPDVIRLTNVEKEHLPEKNILFTKTYVNENEFYLENSGKYLGSLEGQTRITLTNDKRKELLWTVDSKPAGDRLVQNNLCLQKTDFTPGDETSGFMLNLMKCKERDMDQYFTLEPRTPETSLSYKNLLMDKLFDDYGYGGLGNRTPFGGNNGLGGYSFKRSYSSRSY
ncbi:hypothetical protein SLOPH_477 [Spraguea lophii 42_110]|uniref:Uncharacterized protein n=1 Tax=Spraguea lophii (strain 42_110) TaxID=1358809 RepID=S7W996_SPRLO|nr:hypothetical protein SLOPH_477 [Spraguea lophii 42_110]